MHHGHRHPLAIRVARVIAAGVRALVPREGIIAQIPAVVPDEDAEQMRTVGDAMRDAWRWQQRLARR